MFLTALRLWNQTIIIVYISYCLQLVKQQNSYVEPREGVPLKIVDILGADFCTPQTLAKMVTTLVSTLAPPPPPTCGIGKNYTLPSVNLGTLWQNMNICTFLISCIFYTYHYYDHIKILDAEEIIIYLRRSSLPKRVGI